MALDEFGGREWERWEGRPGLLRSAPLRPYMLQLHFFDVFARYHAMVGAQWSGAQ
jgi:hypothetical protein